MELQYVLHGFSASKKVSQHPMFFLTNRSNSFFYNDVHTKNSGWFVSENNVLYRVLAKIRIPAPKVSKVKQQLYTVKQYRNEVTERFFIPFSDNSLVYSTNCTQPVSLLFDVTKTVDGNTTRAQHYEIKEFDKKSVIFAQFDDDSVLHIIVNKNGTVVGSWDEEQYIDSDKPVLLYDAIKVSGPKIVLSAGTNLREMLELNSQVDKNGPIYFSKQQEYIQSFENQSLHRSVAHYALDCAQSSIEHQNVLPYSFLDVRDKIVSMPAMESVFGSHFVKKILLYFLRMLHVDGMIHLPKTKQNDTALWLFKRLYDHSLNNSFTKEEKDLINEKIVSFVDLYQKRYTKNDLLWFDSLSMLLSCKNDGSFNAPIEGQALLLSLYKFAFTITKNEVYLDYEKKLIKKIRSLYFRGNTLARGLSDFTISSHIFLAHYIYPELLSKEEWSSCFSNAISHLLDENGVILDKDSSQSFLWLNNIIAKSLHTTDPNYFKATVEKLFNISKNDLLWKNCFGAFSNEIGEENSLGYTLFSPLCAATFIELDYLINS